MQPHQPLTKDDIYLGLGCTGVFFAYFAYVGWKFVQGHIALPVWVMMVAAAWALGNLLGIFLRRIKDKHEAAKANQRGFEIDQVWPNG